MERRGARTPHRTEKKPNRSNFFLPDPHHIVDKTIRHWLGSGAERPGKYRGANGRSEPYVGLATRKRRPRTGARGLVRCLILGF